MKVFVIFLTLVLISCGKSADKKPESGTSADSKPELDTADMFAEFPGGTQKRDKYIRDNWKWSDSVEPADGYVYVGFIVRKDGTITDIKIVKANGCQSCSSEAIMLVKGMPKWIPSKRNGETIDQKYTFPILFESSTIK